MITCNGCKLEDFLEYSKNFDEVYLNFLTKFDEGKIPNENEIADFLKAEGIIQDENEIKKMIGKSTPDQLTKSVLFSKKDFVSNYKTIKNPEPKMGSPVDRFGLEQEISDHLQQIGIKNFYKFQEDAIREISYGKNVVIEAPR